jgi:hypothetical protein
MFRKRTLRVFLLFLAAGLYSALFLLSPMQGQVVTYLPGQQTTGKGDYKLSGTVVNTVNGEPIPRVLVQITDMNQQTMLTDSQGKFEFDGLPEGQFMVITRKPGFFSGREVPDAAHRSNFIKVGPDTPAATLEMVPEAIIFGRVESGGEPVENLPVKAMAQRIQNGRKVWVQQWGGTTDADGKFRIANLVPGTYYLSVGPHWQRPAAGGTSIDKGFAEVFYTDADDLAGATPIQVSGGQQVEADMTVQSPPLFHVSGTVNVPAGFSANLQLLNWAGIPVPLPTRFDPGTGEFHTSVPAGNFTLRAQTYGPNNTVLSASIPLHLTSDISGIRLALAPGISIPVHVRKENVAPQNTTASVTSWSNMTPNERAFTVVSQDGSMVNVILHSREATLQQRDFYSSYRMEGNTPLVELQNIEPGRYFAEIDGGGSWYAQSAQCGSMDLLRGDLVLAPGAQPPPIEIVLRNDAASLSGTISSSSQEEAGTYNTILIIPDGAPWRARTTSAIRGVHFTIGGFAPGDYSVLAVDDAENFEYTNPEVLRPYLSHAQHVTLQGGETTEVNLDLVHVENTQP